ncbi:hypothetical protein ACFLVP_02090 [Chloroflexota bacterium]
MVRSNSLPTVVKNFEIKKFQKLILRFWDDSGRKNLPWRSTRNPWHILIAEVLLRKTTAVQVSTVFDALIKHSPLDLKKMDVLDLEEKLKPMGMYRVRAKQMQALAEAVEEAAVEDFSDPDFLEKLPGVGRYARNAVLCFAFGSPKPALDTNMIRVISRVFGWQTSRSRAREDKELWVFAEQLVPNRRCREYNWAILDFANMVCRARGPKCGECTLKEICRFYSTDPNNAL